MDTGLAQSIMELKQAEQNFNYADPEYVDIAIIHLLAANMKVNMLLKLRKQTTSAPMCDYFQEESEK